jgi:hypothetical protein
MQLGAVERTLMNVVHGSQSEREELGAWVPARQEPQQEWGLGEEQPRIIPLEEVIVERRCSDRASGAQTESQGGL